jgi:hypothetical protein
MPDLKAWTKRPRVFWIVGAAVVIAVLAVAVVGLVITQAAPSQPFPYTHAPHIAKGIPCLYCHSGAYRGQSAGLPTKAKCLGCHNNIKAETDLLKQLEQYANTHDQFEWVPVALLPDFVYFSHQPHINAHLDCINCHGDVSKMTAAKPQRYWDMGWCLSCHKALAPDKFIKLSDCANCHK